MNEQEAYEFNKAINIAQKRHELQNPNDFSKVDWDRTVDHDQEEGA